MTRKVYHEEKDVLLRSSLIEMHVKCGSIEKALQVFNMAGFRLAGGGRETGMCS
jgi:hypothetical protein